MGVSASSLLDEAQSSYIKGQAEAELRALAPYYRRQFSITRFQQVEEELEQRRETPTQLLMQKGPRQEAEVLYEEHLLYFEENRKWRDRYVVVRANHSLECHDSLETFVRGLPPRHKLLPTGGAVLTEEDAYAALVERCFPGDGGPKEDVAPPLAAMPGPFPLYLRLPYRRDCYFCFKQEAKRRGFASVLSDCIRHQNQDFLKKKTCEVQAFLKAVQLRRRDQGSYGPWDMLMGSDVRVMGNLVMEKLLPTLEEDLLPRLKARRTERKRLWFATVEAAYILAQEHLLEALARLKEECRAGARQQEVRIRADMDQILQSRRQLEDRVRAVVTEPAEKLCSESVRPYLDSVLEELMEPISCGFQEGRELLEGLMEEACRSARRGGQEDARKPLPTLAKPNLLSCYQKIAAVRENQQNLQVRFGFSHPIGLIHSTQMDLEQLMENAVFTFEQLLYTTSRDDVGSAPEKAKERVLKRYDGDSSAVRKRICRQALLSVTLPFVQKELDAALKEEIRNLEEVLDPEHSSFVHVQNVYESILQQALDEALTQVATLRKLDLPTDSQTSRCSLLAPPSAPAASGAAPPQEGVAGNGAAVPEAEPPNQVETPPSADADDQREELEGGAAPGSQQEVNQPEPVPRGGSGGSAQSPEGGPRGPRRRPPLPRLFSQRSASQSPLTSDPSPSPVSSAHGDEDTMTGTQSAPPEGPGPPAASPPACHPGGGVWT